MDSTSSGERGGAAEDAEDGGSGDFATLFRRGTGAYIRDAIFMNFEDCGPTIHDEETYDQIEIHDDVIKPGERVLVNGGLSKAYALPGLRLGWLVDGDRRVQEFKDTLAAR